MFLSRFRVKAEEGRRKKFQSLEVREANSSHLESKLLKNDTIEEIPLPN